MELVRYDINACHGNNSAAEEAIINGITQRFMNLIPTSTSRRVVYQFRKAVVTMEETCLREPFDSRHLSGPQ